MSISQTRISTFGRFQTFSLSQLILVLTLAITVYLIYHGYATLHDVSHYIVAGVTATRDHADLVYPYSTMNPPGATTAYSFFQDNNRFISLEKAMPSKLYVLTIGHLNSALSTGWFFNAHMISLITFCGYAVSVCLLADKLFSTRLAWLFTMSAMLYPLTIAVLAPGNDIVGLFLSTLVVFLVLATEANLILIGILIGISAHFRNQLIFLAPAVFILLSFGEWKRGGISARIFLLIFSVASYLIVSKLTMHYSSGGSQYDGGINFYYEFFRKSFHGAGEWEVLFFRFVDNLIKLASPSCLGLLLIALIVICISKDRRDYIGLIGFSLVMISVPLTVFTFDSTSLAHARYYVYAVPSLIFAWFLFIDRGHHAAFLAPATLAIIAVSTFFTYGIPTAKFKNPTSIITSLMYLDFSGVQVALDKIVEPDDLVMINHSIPAGMRKFDYVLPVPSFDEFFKGDNREVDEIVFVYGESGVDAFFKPVDWMRNDQLPDEIKDGFGNRFVKVKEYLSHGPTTAHFTIFRNSSKAIKRFNVSGRRIFQSRYSEDLNVTRTTSPEFVDPRPWSGRVERPQSGEGVITGPGDNNPNVLSQRFDVTPNERLRIRTVVQGTTGSQNLFRLQLNWLDKNDAFIGADLSVLPVGRNPEEFKRTVRAPPDARSAIIYATPGGDHDVVLNRLLEVLGQSER